MMRRFPCSIPFRGLAALVLLLAAVGPLLGHVGECSPLGHEEDHCVACHSHHGAQATTFVDHPILIDHPEYGITTAPPQSPRVSARNGILPYLPRPPPQALS